MLEEYNYDSCLPVRSKAKAGGRRRNPTNWSYTGVSLPTYTNRGFTGHEHLDMFSLIHMLSEAKSREQSEAGNGRIYDPEISRFLSPDPVIQDPYSMLNYNRYTYCLNNPLKYTDPSGYVKAEVEPGMIWTNPGWLKYADPTHLNNYFDYLESLGGGSGNIVEVAGVYWDEDTKSYRDKKDGKPLSQDEFLTYLKWVISGATNGGGDYLVYDWTASKGTFMTTGTLSWYNGNGKVIGSWSANSGNTNALAIPSGVWTVSNYRPREESGYTRHDIGFSVDITPDHWGREALRIHPDGEEYLGTLGCIGLTGDAAALSLFSNMISNRLSGGQTMPLYVTGNMINLGEIKVYP